MNKASHFKVERWRPVVGFVGLYEVSNLGRVRSVARWVKCRDGKGLSEGIVLKPKRGRGGYAIVNLSNSKISTRYIHRLVAEAFCPGAGPEIRHLDGDLTNNNSDNLAWGTSKENAADRMRHGRVLIGENNHRAKLTDENVRTIRTLRGRGFSLSAIAKAISVGSSTVGRVVSGTAWGHVK